MYGWWFNVGCTWWFWVVVAVAVAVYLAIWVLYDDFDEWLIRLLGDPFVCASGAAVLWWAGIGVFNLVLPHHDLTAKHDLVVLRDTSSVSGSVVLGSGYLKDGPAFSFYVRQDGYNQYLVVRSNNNTRVYEDLPTGQTPWLVTLDDCALWGKVATCFIEQRWVTEIHVPPNTIKPGLVLDGAA